MAGKPLVRASKRVARVIDELSKNCLADIVIDRVKAEIGDDATDEAVLAHLQPWIDTITRLRGDRQVNLASLDAQKNKNDSDYRKAHGLS
jgi:hypothetical protein